MSNNRERILKYFSGMLDNESEFLSELDTNSELREEYDRVKKHLGIINEVKNLELDEKYFTSSEIRVKEKLGKKELRRFSPRFVYGISSAAVVLIIFLIFNFNRSTDLNSSEMLHGLLEDFNSDEVLSELENNYTQTDIYSTSYAYADYTDIFTNIENNVDLVSDVTDISSIYSNDYINDLTEQELDEILKQLENKEYF